MLRRCNSSSHIPVPRNLFNADGARKRSASATRLSQRNSNASTATTRPQGSSSTEGKSCLNRLSRQNSPNRLSKNTPLNVPKRARPNSLQKTPHSEQKSLSSNRTGIGSALKSQDRKTIQKLSTDTKWVAEQYAKVQHFIATSGLFDSNIVTENNIKPPSIRAFIYVTTVLMKKIFPSVTISNDNYKEVITEKLKVLNYPGTLANSVLKTVNTMHVWPQVIGMFGWLIDKINVQLEIGNLELLDPSYRQSYQLTQVCKRFLLERYSIFNSGNNEERNLQVNKDYVQSLTEILEVNPERYEELVVEIAKNKEYKLKQETEIKSLLEDNKNLEEKIDQLKKDIEEAETQHVIRETDVDGEIKYLTHKLKKVMDKQTVLASQVVELEESVKTSACSYQEKLTLLKTIDSLNDEIRIKKEKMEFAHKLKEEFDATLEEERNQFRNKVFQWNNFLMKWTIKKPQLKPLLLKETGFHSPSYLTITKEVIKQKNAIENDLAKELQEMGCQFEKEKVTNKKLETELLELIKLVDDLTDEYTKTHQCAEKTTEKLLNLKTEWNATKNAFRKEIELMGKNSDVELVKQQATDLKIKKESLREEVSKFAIKTLTFFVDLHNQVEKDITEMENIRTNVLEDGLESMIAREKAFIEQLKK